MTDDIRAELSLSEAEAMADGRPNVYTKPATPNFANVAGRHRVMHPDYKDRLLLALRHYHGRDGRPDLMPDA